MGIDRIMVAYDPVGLLAGQGARRLFPVGLRTFPKPVVFRQFRILLQEHDGIPTFTDARGQVSLMVPAYKTAIDRTALQLIGECQTSHDMPGSDELGPIDAKRYSQCQTVLPERIGYTGC